MDFEEDLQLNDSHVPQIYALCRGVSSLIGYNILFSACETLGTRRRSTPAVG